MRPYFSMDIMTNNLHLQDGSKVWDQPFLLSKTENFMAEVELMMDMPLTAL